MQLLIRFQTLSSPVCGTSVLVYALAYTRLSIVLQKYVTWVMILLFLIGKLGITSSFGIVYVHTSELLPTIIRSSGVGSASTVARLGALLAPFVPMLANPLPMIIFGSTAVFAGLIALKLPETAGKKLPDTIIEAEAL